MDAVQAGMGQHMVNDLHRVMRANADIAQPGFAYAFEQGTHTCLVYFAA